MADNTLKKLLLKVDVATKDFQVAVKEMRSLLETVNAKAKKDALEMKAVQKESIDLTKQQISDQKRLQAEARTLLEVDKAKAAWEQKNQEALKTKIQHRILETVELKKQGVSQQQAIGFEQEQVRLESQKLKLAQQQDALLEKTERAQQARLAAIKKEQSDAQENLRRQTAQQKISGAVSVAGQLPIPQLAEAQILQLRESVNQEKQRLAVMQAELRVQSTQEGVKREDLELAAKQIAEERAKLGIQEAQLRQSEQQLRLQQQKERVSAATVSKTDVQKIQQRIGFSPYTPPVMGGLFGASSTQVVADIGKEKEKLMLMEAELKVMAQQEEFRKIDIISAQKSIVEEQERLHLLEMQVAEKREQSLFSKVTGGVGSAREGIGGAVKGLLGGSFGQLAGGMFTGFVGAELFTGMIEKVHELGKAIVEDTGAASQMREEFEKLAGMKGVDATETLDKLRVATRGLVSDLDLYKVANAFMRSGIRASSEDFMKLISNTVELGRSMNKSPTLATQKLTQAFLRNRMTALSQITGINALLLTLRGIPSTVDASTRSTMQFSHALALTNEAVDKFGKVQTTVPEIMEQIRNAEKNFIEDVARGIITQGNFNATLDDTQKKLTALAPTLEHDAIVIGGEIAKAIHFVVDNMHELKVITESLLLLGFGVKMLQWAAAAKELAIGIGLIKAAETGLGSAGTLGTAETVAASAAGKVATTAATAGGISVAAIASTVSAVLGILGLSWLITEESSKHGGGKAADVGITGGGGFGRATMMQHAAQNVIAFNRPPEAPKPVVVTPPVVVPPKPKKTDMELAANEVTIAEQRKLAQQKLQISEAINKVILEESKLRTTEEERLLKEQYEVGLISLQDFVTKEKTIKNEEYQASVKQINSDTAAQIKNVHDKNSVVVDGKEWDVSKAADKAFAIKLIDEKAKAKLLEAEIKHNQEIVNLTKQSIDDQTVAYRAYVEDINKVQTEGVAERTSILESEFKQGNVGADAYIEQRKELMREEYDLTVQGLNDRKAAAKNNAAEEAKIEMGLIEAKQKYDIDSLKFSLSTDDVRLKSLQTHFDQAKKYLDVQATIAKGTPNSHGQQLGITQQLQSLNNQYLDSLQDQIKPLQVGSEEWSNINEKIAQATEEQQKLNLELAQMKDSAAPLAGIFGSLSGLLGQFKGARSQGISELLSGMSSSMQDLSKFGLFMDKLRTPTTSFKQTPEQIRDTAQKLFNENLTRSSNTMEGLSTRTAELSALFAKLAEASKALIDNEVKGLPANTRSAPSLGTDQGVTKAPLDYSHLDISQLMPSYEVGTDYVPKTGPAIIHKGETILTVDEVKRRTQEIKDIKTKIATLTSQITQTQSSTISTASTGAIPTGAATMLGIVQMLGLGGYMPMSILSGVMGGQAGILNPISKLPAQYQSTVHFIDSIDPKYLSELMSAMKTKPGSAQRRQLAAESKQYGSEVNTAGFDFGSFEKWLVAGSQVTGQKFKDGGPVTQTGLAEVDAGEFVLTPQMIGGLTKPSTSDKTDVSYHNLVHSLTQLITNVKDTVISGVPAEETHQKIARIDNGITVLKHIVTGRQLTASQKEELKPVFEARKSLATIVPHYIPPAPSVMVPGSDKATHTVYRETQSFPQVKDSSSVHNWLSLAPKMTGQKFAQGGPVNQTGLAQVDQGEYVMSNPMMSVLNSFGIGGQRGGIGSSSLPAAGQLNGILMGLIGSFRTVSSTLASVSSSARNAAMGLTALKPQAVSSTLNATSSAGFNVKNLQSPFVGPVLKQQVKDTMGAQDSQHSATGAPLQTAMTKLITPFENLFKSSSQAADGTKNFASKLGDAEEAIVGIVAGLTGLVKGVSGGKSAAGGALSGAASGAKFGTSIMPGYGTAIGAVAGGIAGGIIGQKNNNLMQDTHKITTQLNSIVADLQAGTISMGQALADLRKERQTAIQTLSKDPKGGKGGGKGGKKGYNPTQAQAVIEQIDSQIEQLVDQQTAVLDSLHQSLIEISSPLQFQDYLSSLDQIITKYQQFASAASGNAQEMAAANQFLNDSLQNYVTTLSQQLNQAQQTAINDALTLINLEYQRQQLINQEAQQEYDVLTQGVEVRQRTTAMTKGQEIGQLRYQRDMQLEQINEQIALEQFKVDQETKIFGLATTRIGLETQLLAAQEDQANYQILQIQALAQVVAALNSGMSSGQLTQELQNIESNGSLPTGTSLLYLLAQELGLGQYVPPSATQGIGGTTNWLANVPAQYVTAANYVAALSPNFVDDLTSALSAAPGSAARQQAESDIQPDVAQGEVEGYDMRGLMSWLSSVPAFLQGGPVMQTGPAIVHKGEYVLSVPMLGALSGLQNMFNSKPSAASPEDVSSAKLSTESTLYTMTQQRTGLEMQVVSARQTLLNAEMQHLSMLNDTLQAINEVALSGGPTGNLEAAFQKVYETRGRYGSANFRTETL